jgi:DNA-binding response OmpR family regulator
MAADVLIVDDEADIRELIAEFCRMRDTKLVIIAI